MRIGHGFDAHRFGPGRAVVLGGVTIPAEFSIIAHSDGDVLVHALCDALLGAATLGDIGRHFSSNDRNLKGVDSRRMLRDVMGLLSKRGLRVCHADLTLVAEVPKIAPHVDAMRRVMAQDMAITADAVNVKATTPDGMGYIGRREGIAAHAVVLLAEARSIGSGAST